MRCNSLTPHSGASLGWLLTLCSGTLCCAPAPESTRIPPAPLAFRWPDPAFLPKRQCHGAYTIAELERYLPRAQVALQVPGTRAVALDAERRCLTVTVDDIGAGRLAELVLRGVAVPRAAVLLQLAAPGRQG
jgi:hypothetical protein